MKLSSAHEKIELTCRYPLLLANQTIPGSLTATVYIFGSIYDREPLPPAWFLAHHPILRPVIQV
jgi:hypothetical protein